MKGQLWPIKLYTDNFTACFPLSYSEHTICSTFDVLGTRYIPRTRPPTTIPTTTPTTTTTTLPTTTEKPCQTRSVKFNIPRGATSVTKEVMPGSKLTLEAGHHVYRVLRPDGSMECAIDITVIGERLAMRKWFKSYGLNTLLWFEPQPDLNLTITWPQRLIY